MYFTKGEKREKEENNMMKKKKKERIKVRTMNHSHMDAIMDVLCEVCLVLGFIGLLLVIVEVVLFAIFLM